MVLKKLKPAAPAWAHLLVAALMWTVVGLVLGHFGVSWALRWDSPWMPWVLAVAVLLGAGKGVFVMRKAAARTVARIRERGDGKCIGGFVPWPTWFLILGMIGLGRLLRSGFLAPTTVGFVYAAIGAALLIGASFFWAAFVRKEWRPQGP